MQTWNEEKTVDRVQYIVRLIRMRHDFASLGQATNTAGYSSNEVLQYVFLRSISIAFMPTTSQAHCTDAEFCVEKEVLSRHCKGVSPFRIYITMPSLQAHERSEPKSLQWSKQIILHIIRARVQS